MRETHILETKNVGRTLGGEGGGGLKKCTVCTLMKMLTFLDGPVTIIYLMLNMEKKGDGTRSV